MVVVKVKGIAITGRIIILAVAGVDQYLTGATDVSAQYAGRIGHRRRCREMERVRQGARQCTGYLDDTMVVAGRRDDIKCNRGAGM